MSSQLKQNHKTDHPLTPFAHLSDPHGGYTKPHSSNQKLRAVTWRVFASRAAVQRGTATPANIVSTYLIHKANGLLVEPNPEVDVLRLKITLIDLAVFQKPGQKLLFGVAACVLNDASDLW